MTAQAKQTLTIPIHSEQERREEENLRRKILYSTVLSTSLPFSTT